MKKTRALDWILYNKKYWTRIMKHSFIVLVCILFSKSTNAQITINATAGQAFGIRMTLDSVFDDINAGVYQGDIVMKIQKSFTLTRAAVLNNWYNSNLNYNSILLTVSDTATIPVEVTTNYINSSSNQYMLKLYHVKNFTIQGNNNNNISNLLTFNFTNMSTLNGSKRIIFMEYGGTNVSFKNCKFNYSGLKNAANFSTINMSTTNANDSNINIINNIFSAGYNHITITAITSIINSIIKGNQFQNFEATSLGISGYIKNVTIDSNHFFHSFEFTPNHTSSVNGIIISFKSITDSNVVYILKNRIFGLRNDTASIIGMNLSTDNTSFISPDKIYSYAYVYNNSICILDSNDLINRGTNLSSNSRLIYATIFGGDQIFVDFQNNTIRIGGVCTNTYSQYNWINSAALSCATQSNTSFSRFILKNNLIINERIGCTMSIHFAYLESDSFMYIKTNCDYNNYYALNNTGSNIIFRKKNTNYSNLTDFKKDRVPLDSHSSFYQVVFSDTINSRIAPASQNNINLLGVPSPNVTSDIDGNPRDPRYPYKGASEPAPFQFHDLQAQAVINLNDSFINCKNQTLKLRIINNGNVGDSFSVNNPLQVNTKIIRPGGSVLNLPTSTINSGMLNSGDSMDIILSNALNMDSVGLYSFTTSINRTIDYNRSNDTLTFTRRVLNNEYGDSAVQAIQLNAQSTKHFKNPSRGFEQSTNKNFYDRNVD